MNDDRVAPTMPEGRRAVLYALRRRGQASAADIARQLDMTVSGARQHLSALVDEGFAEAGELPRPPGQRGRAQLAYTVTEKADGLFPKAYGELTNELLGYALETDAQLVDTLFARRRDERIRNAVDRLSKCRTLHDKVAELTSILDGDGYLATFEEVGEGTFRVVEHNCAIWAVAQRYGQACSSEIDFIRAVLPEADVERVQHMVAGAPHCAYEVRLRGTNEESPSRVADAVV
jgi:DeoR family transcriptional regulator, suf operon transcriptional repressor